LFSTGQYAHFSKAVEEVSAAHKQDAVAALKTMADTVSAYAQSTSATWPNFTLPLFETYAKNALLLSRAETLQIFNVVTKREEYISYATENYKQWVAEGHLHKHGSVGARDDHAYNPFISMMTSEGPVADLERNVYFAAWTSSPPPDSYGQINYNTGSLPDVEKLLYAAIALKNETLVGKSQPKSHYQVLQTEHSDSHVGSRDDHPHSFIYLVSSHTTSSLSFAKTATDTNVSRSFVP
jgi:hypothetical protein